MLRFSPLEAFSYSVFARLTIHYRNKKYEIWFRPPIVLLLLDMWKKSRWTVKLHGLAQTWKVGVAAHLCADRINWFHVQSNVTACDNYTIIYDDESPQKANPQQQLRPDKLRKRADETTDWMTLLTIISQPSRTSHQIKIIFIWFMIAWLRTLFIV